MKFSAILLLGIFLLSMGGGAFIYAIASHGAQFEANAILPDGSEAPLQSLLQPTDFRAVKVAGWAQADFSGGDNLPAEVYYEFMIDGNVALGWKKGLDIELKKGVKTNFNFTISKDEVAEALGDVNLSEAAVDIHVTVVPKGLDPNKGPAVDAAGFKTIDMAKVITEEQQNDPETKQLRLAHGGGASTTTTTTATSYKQVVKSSSERTTEYVKKYANLYAGGNETEVKEIEEAVASGQDVTLNVGNCEHLHIDPSTPEKLICEDGYHAPYRHKRVVRIVRKDFTLPNGEWELVKRENRGGVMCYTWKLTNGPTEKTYCEDKYHKLPQEAKGNALVERRRGGIHIPGRVLVNKYIYRTAGGAYTVTQILPSETQGHEVSTTTASSYSGYCYFKGKRIANGGTRTDDSGLVWKCSNGYWRLQHSILGQTFLIDDIAAATDAPVNWPLLMLASLLLLGGVVLVGREVI